jgi:hypothetical protein
MRRDCTYVCGDCAAVEILVLPCLCPLNELSCGVRAAESCSFEPAQTLKLCSSCVIILDLSMINNR